MGNERDVAAEASEFLRQLDAQGAAATHDPAPADEPGHTAAPSPALPSPESARLIARERIALIGMAVGWMTGGIGWLIGVLALITCRRWQRLEKVSVALITLLLPGAAVQVGTSGGDADLVNVGGFAVLIAITWSSLYVLARRLRQRPHVPAASTPSRVLTER